MRISLLFLSLLLTLSSAAQKRIHAADWCANGKQLLATPPPTVASDMRSDSIDILSTTIALAATDFAKKEVSGYALIEFAAKVDGIAEIRLDVLNMTIDQVAPAANWSYDGALLQTADFGAEIQGFGLGDAVFRDFAEIQQCARSAAGSLRARLAKIAEILAYKALLAGFECLFFEFLKKIIKEIMEKSILANQQIQLFSGKSPGFLRKRLQIHELALDRGHFHDF